MKSTRFTKFLAVLLTALIPFAGVVLPAYGQAQQSAQPSRTAGKFYANSYGRWQAHTTTSTAASAGSIVSDTGIPTSSGSSDARYINAFQNAFPKGGGFIPVLVDVGSGVQETVTITGASGCNTPQNQTTAGYTCVLTGTFANAHGAGALLQSGTFGLQEAINDAAANGGGIVVIDADWFNRGGTLAMVIAASVASNISIENDGGVPNGPPFYVPGQGGATILAAPVALTAQAACDATHTFCSDTSVVGTWTSGTIHGCVAYVDILGQEGPCALTDAGFTTVASKAIDVGTPAASAGAVGFVIYLDLIGGTYAASYSVPITPAICTMTQLETTTPACAVTNSSFGQVGSTFGANALFTGGAVVPAVTLATSPGMLLKTTASATTAYVGTPNGRSVAAVYVPSARPYQGFPAVSFAYAITTAAATTVPNVVATINLPPGYFNQMGKSVRVCGFSSSTGTSTATVVGFTLWYEASLSNAAGPLPLIVGGPNVTGTLASAIDNYSYCQDVTTSATGATGALLPGTGYLTYADTVAGTHPFSGPNVQVGAPGAPNLVNSGGFPTHLHVVYLHTTNTDGAGMITQKLTVELL